MSGSRQQEGESMKLNRRDTLLAILAMPSATSYAMVREMQAQNGTKVSVLSPVTRFILDLADADDEKAGVCELQVNYKGQQVKFSAKEIWDALKT